MDFPETTLIHLLVAQTNKQVPVKKSKIHWLYSHFIDYPAISAHMANSFLNHPEK
jgi:hypothetical protein